HTRRTFNVVLQMRVKAGEEEPCRPPVGCHPRQGALASLPCTVDEYHAGHMDGGHPWSYGRLGSGHIDGIPVAI
ncbi:MAG: hypothetical protein ACRDNW_10015, partial [Trebonia sp.]